MATFHDEIDEKLRDFIGRQLIFFTATAPDDGRINLSPKGMDTFRVLDPKRVAYLDMTGSGNESAAHLLENGRMTIMFCSFSKRPTILRLYGHGHVVAKGSEEWNELRPRFGRSMTGERQIIVLDVDSLQTSCGYAVPVFENGEARPMLEEWAERKGEEELKSYRRKKNSLSIDGLATGLTDDA